jgi:UDP-glucose 4-epimerase
LQGLEYRFIEGCIIDYDVVRDAMVGIDYVFHLAAMISVPELMLNPRECVNINVQGLLIVLEACKTGWC